MIHSCLYKTCFGLLTMLACLNTLAQLPNYQLNRIQEEGGLRTSGIIAIAKDSKGFLWLATQSQVYQFDGRHTRTYAFNESVVRIFIDSKDRKWVMTRGSIFLFTDNYRGFHEVRGKPASGYLYEAMNGKVYMLNAGKHHLFDEKQQVFVETVLPVPVEATRYIGKLDHSLFFAGDDSIFRYNQQTKAVSSVYVGSVNTAVTLNQQRLLVSNTRYKTFYVDMQRQEVKLLDDDLVLYAGIDLQDGRHFMSSNKGLFQYNAATGSITWPVLYYSGRPLENQQSTNALYKDDAGNIYMNHADGVFFMNSGTAFIQYFRNYRSGNVQMPDNDVRNFAEDELGNIWMATTNGITRLNMKSGALENFDPLNNSSTIDYPSYRQLLNDGPYLWIGTSGNGVWVYDKRTGLCKRPATDTNALEQAYVWKILKLRNNKILVVAGARLFIIDPSTLTARQVPFNRGSEISRAALQDSSGRIWHGTTAGLSCLDTSFNVLFKIRDSFPDKRVASFCEWKKNRMLVGSKGLFLVELEGNNLIAFKRSKAVPEQQFIYCMKQDRQGFVWLGTDDGIFRYDPLKDEALLFDRSDHVQSQAFNSDAAFMSRSGLLFMGGRNGVNYFDPSTYVTRVEKLNPFILSFAVNIDDSTYYGPGQRIPYSSRNIDFIISAPEFKKPFRLQYRYRLQNESDQWSYTGFNNNVRISSLQPGNYALQVSASYDGNTWFDGAVITSFTVLKPWWQTWWFRILCVLAAVLALWGVFRYRRKKREAAEMKRAIDYFTYPGSTDESVGLILWDIARNCISRLGFEDCVIYLLDEERNVLVQKAAYGAKGTEAFEIANPIEIPVGKGITGQVAETRKTVIVHDTSKDHRYIVDDERRLSEIAVPIIHDGKLIGVIDSEHRRRNFFTEHHLKTLETISSLCASKIATAVALEAARKAEAELLALNNKMLESKFVNLRLQMNPHFLFNILTTIQYLIVSNQANKAKNYLDIFSGFLRSLLSYAESTVVTLEDELKILSMYVELESLCLDETFVWEVTVDEEVDKDEVLVPFMLLQPFVENAINHGLIHKTGVKHFSIAIKEHDPDSLVCIIEDNGIGRAASAAINSRSLSRVVHESKGISIVEKRLELLQQKTAKKACFEIEDLYRNGVAAGTRVKIVIPYYSTEEI